MKKLLLFFVLLSTFCFGQIESIQVCNMTETQAKAYSDELSNMAKDNFRFYGIEKGYENTLYFMYVPTNISADVIEREKPSITGNSYEKIEIVFESFMAGKNDDLRIAGEKRYRMQRAHGQFLNILPFWKKYYNTDTTVENYKDYAMREFRKDNLLMKLQDADDGFWYIQTFYCP
ncbi:hypothetical protein [Chryseobacterium sp.]|uniref:hypothetical protein n=1 Tax=Chryseobacterium sp. TaxID=1871047 RepID=UPI00289DBC86|nr:hypothetical protein [Chryseobacterium sp.]